MKKDFLLEMYLLRHGETEYTDVFPDLTVSGIQAVGKTAEAIKENMERNASFLILSSQQKRAMGSAYIIANRLGYEKPIVLDPFLRRIDFRNKEIAERIFLEYRENKNPAEKIIAVDLAYANDWRFDDSAIFETRYEAKRRFYNFLARKISETVSGAANYKCYIAVTHYEVLYHFVQNLFNLDYKKGDKTLKTAELIIVTVFESNEKNIVKLRAEFRGQTRENLLFDYEKGILIDYKDFS